MADLAEDTRKLKKALRSTCAARRDAIPPEQRARASAKLAEAGAQLLGGHTGAIVSAYSAMGSELDPSTLLESLASLGLAGCLPVIQPLGQPLLFRLWRAGEPLVARTWGIREPTDQAPLAEPDVLLVPLLAFDRRGARLGYGGGYYDRTIERLRGLKSILTVGVAFAGQELSEVPCERHDQRLDWVLTPEGAIKTG